MVFEFKNYLREKYLAVSQKLADDQYRQRSKYL
jgi:hypothetical protein